MSFPKAKTKRFNEVDSCAPPVGSYNVKGQDKTGGPASFEKSSRFKEPKAPPPGSLHQARSNSSTSLTDAGRTPSKNLNSTVDPSFNKSVSFTPCKHDKEIQELKHELRQQKQEWSAATRELSQTQEKLAKAEGKLQAMVREKTALAGQLATKDREVADLQKARDVLQTKVGTFEGNGTKNERLLDELSSVTSKLGAKQQELEMLKSTMELKVHTLEANLEESRTKMAALQQTKEALELNKMEVQAHSEDLESEITKLHSLTDKLRLDNEDLGNKLEKEQKQNKVSTLEGDSSKNERLLDELSSVTSRLDAKQQELEMFKSTMELKVHTLEADLEESKSKMAALQQTKEALELNKKEIQAHSEDLESEISKLHSLTDELRLDNVDLGHQLEKEQERNEFLHKEVERTLDNSKRRALEREEELQTQLKQSSLKLEELQTALESAEERVGVLQVAYDTETRQRSPSQASSGGQSSHSSSGFLERPRSRGSIGFFDDPSSPRPSTTGLFYSTPPKSKTASLDRTEAQHSPFDRQGSSSKSGRSRLFRLGWSKSE